MSIELKVPAVGESITEVEIGQWLKAEGEAVAKDETVAMIETEKATVELPAPEAGTLSKILKRQGETAKVGETVGQLEEGKAAAATPAQRAEAEPTKTEPPAEPPMAPRPSRGREPERRSTPAPATPVAEHVEATGPGGPAQPEDKLRRAEGQRPKPEPGQTAPPSGEGAGPAPSPATAPAATVPGREEQIVRMTLLRRTVAKRLVEAQHTAALLTTFNEIDMSAALGLRQQYQEAFQKQFGLKLGLMSFFVKAATDALKRVPQLNAEVRDTDVVYRNYHDIALAVSTDRGLVVPVLREVDRLSFAEIERAVADFARRARENQLKPEELEGGTFTITNGGVFGSLLSTPLINPPQSGILAMHAIQERPVAVAGQVVIRPMMYVALTYDHRLVDGREAVTFLKRVKEVVENPARLLLEV